MAHRNHQRQQRHFLATVRRRRRGKGCADLVGQCPVAPYRSQPVDEAFHLGRERPHARRAAKDDHVRVQHFIHRHDRICARCCKLLAESSVQHQLLFIPYLGDSADADRCAGFAPCSLCDCLGKRQRISGPRVKNDQYADGGTMFNPANCRLCKAFVQCRSQWKRQQGKNQYPADVISLPVVTRSIQGRVESERRRYMVCSLEFSRLLNRLYDNKTTSFPPFHSPYSLYSRNRMTEDGRPVRVAPHRTTRWLTQTRGEKRGKEMTQIERCRAVRKAAIGEAAIAVRDGSAMSPAAGGQPLV